MRINEIEYVMFLSKGSYMRTFKLNVSRNFKGGEYYASFEADNVFDFNKMLIKYWHSAAITRETGEMFIFTDIENGEKVHKFQVGFYVVESDEIFALKSIGCKDDEMICESLVKNISDEIDEEIIYNKIVKALFKN